MMESEARSHRGLVAGWALLGLAGAGACGTESSGGGPAGAATTITVRTGDPPALIAFRDGADAPWQMPTAAAPGRYEIAVHGPYTVETVCLNGASAATRARSLTPEDPTDVEMPCPLVMPADSHVTGTTSNVRNGFIAIGRATASLSSARPQFDLVVPNGTYDMQGGCDPDHAAHLSSFRWVAAYVDHAASHLSESTRPRVVMTPFRPGDRLT